MKRPGRQRTWSKLQQGFSLIELLISMVVGMVIVGAVFAAYLSTGTSSRNSRALAQMTEDVSLAMNILRSHIAMAGYSSPTGINADGTFIKNYAGMAVKGCSSNFADAGAAIDALACSGEGADSIAVAFEADARNSMVSDAGLPLDCLGNALTVQPGDFYVSYSRFYVDNEGKLLCRGPGNDAAAALVENIVDMQVSYGVASNTELHQVAYYSRAGNAGEMNNADFDRVVSARVCLLVASEGNVMDAPTAYVDCQGDSRVPADNRLYRAFTSTIVLQNRMGMN